MRRETGSGNSRNGSACFYRSFGSIAIEFVGPFLSLFLLIPNGVQEKLIFSVFCPSANIVSLSHNVMRSAPTKGEPAGKARIRNSPMSAPPSDRMCQWTIATEAAVVRLRVEGFLVHFIWNPFCFQRIRFVSWWAESKSEISASWTYHVRSYSL